MKNTKAILLLITLTAFLLACESPILNHADANDLRKTSNFDPNSDSRLTSTCPLSFAKSKLCASLEWLSPPSLDEEKPGRVRVRFWSAETGSPSGPYVNVDSQTSGLKVGVKVWMPDMGHGSAPVKVGASKDSQGGAITGVYESQEIYFSMGGHWEVFVQLKQGTAVVEQTKLDVNL